MREKELEAYLVREVCKAGGRAYKFTSPGRRNVPDRLAVWPGSVMHFVELKAPGKKLTAAQEREHERLAAMGFLVLVHSSKEQVFAYAKWYGART